MQVYPLPEQSLQKIGENFVNYRTIPSGVTTLVDPSSNTKGLILRSLHLALDAATNGSIFISSTAPSGPDDTSKRSLVFYWSAIATNIIFPYQIYVEAGEGIYLANDPAGGRISMTYDLIS